MMDTTRLNDQYFEKYRKLIDERLGISIEPAKKYFLQARLDKLMYQNRIGSYQEYYQMLTGTAQNRYWPDFADGITIHKTAFFREGNHFEFIKKNCCLILKNNPRIVKNREIRAWSAGCSTGEEPYTLGATLQQSLPPEITIKILGTDVSRRALQAAREGVYPATIGDEVTEDYLRRYFRNTDEGYQVLPSLRELVTFRQFNLMEPFPFRDTFDIIFCRNVMIYFDAATQQKLIRKFYEVTCPGGLLFIGHSESINNKQNHYRYLQPTIYQK